MTVKILIVEDDASFLEVVSPIILDFGMDISLNVAKSRDSALGILESDCFDFIILDLKIPTTDESLDLDVGHGRAVFEATRNSAPGTPIVILTGSPSESFIQDFLDRSTKVDVWGDNKSISTIAFLRKSNIDKLADIIGPYVASVRAVQDIEVRSSSSRVNLNWEQDRLIRIFVRRRGGASCTVFRLSGGLSGAHVFRVPVYDQQGVTILNSIVKIGAPEMIESEVNKYKKFAQRLKEPATARLIEDVRHGASRSAAVTYRLADTFVRTMFDVAAENPTKVPEVIGAVFDLMRPWHEGVPESRITIGDIRRRLLSDEKADGVAKAYGLNWVPHLENRSVQVRMCCIHGDLHGGNILVDDGGVPILIDYGDIDEGAASLDWVTLELSLFFHPDGSARTSAWPSAEACAQWSNVDNFSADSAFANFIRACRNTSAGVSAGPREVAAAAYAYLLRQLRYGDTDKARALALLDACRKFIETT